MNENVAVHGSFRKKVGFTSVQNYITRDRTISLKAKGLYLLIQSYITMPDKVWLKDDFMKMTLEGKKAFDSAWNELKEKGYLKVHICSSSHTWIHEYELLEEPRTGAHTFYYNAEGSVVSTNYDRAAKRNSKAVAKSSAKESAIEDEDLPIEDIQIEEISVESVDEKIDRKEEQVLADHQIPKLSTENDGIRRCTQKGDIVNSGSGRNTQKGYIVKSEERRYTHFGGIENGDTQNGPPQKVGNNNKDYIVKTNDYKDYSINPSIQGEECPRSDGRMDGEQPVILDLSRSLRPHQSDYAKKLLQTEGSMPYYLSADKENMKIVIQYLCAWNDYVLKGFDNELERNAYLLVVKGIIEMATAKEMKTYNKSTVSYKHVIDQLNIILEDSEFQKLYFFVEQTMERFMKALKEKEIRNPEQYVKSVIWSNFSSYKIDWDSYFYRNYNAAGEQ